MSEHLAAADRMSDCNTCSGTHYAGECTVPGSKGEQILWTEIMGGLRREGYTTDGSLAMLSAMKQVIGERARLSGNGGVA